MSEHSTPTVATPSEPPLLAIRDLRAGYAEDEVLHGVSLDVRPGQVVTLVGRNGAGKSTIMRSIMGILPKRSGSIVFNGVETISLPPERIARLGVGYVPEERGIFSRLTVEENMQLPALVSSANALSRSEVFELFPNLSERLHSPGAKLSGGEQQMLAIARVLRTGARFLLLDEPTEGLAPVIVRQIGLTIGKLKKSGFTILLVEQNIHFASTVTDRYFVIEEGHVVDQMPQLSTADAVIQLERYLGI